MHQVRSIAATLATLYVVGVGLTAAEPQASPPCRTFTADEVRTMSGAATGTIAQTCQFDPRTTSRICTMRARLSHTSFDLALTDKYNSVADFVDEIRIVPPISRIQSQSRRYLSGSAPNAQITYEYDAARRQTRLSTNMSGNVLVTTYSAWDPLGRPTTALVTSGASTFNLQYKYDNALRTMTTTGPTGVQVVTYDADGNMIREESTDGGGKAVYAIKINKTEKVCK